MTITASAMVMPKGAVASLLSVPGVLPVDKVIASVVVVASLSVFFFFFFGAIVTSGAPVVTVSCGATVSPAASASGLPSVSPSRSVLPSRGANVPPLPTWFLLHFFGMGGGLRQREAKVVTAPVLSDTDEPFDCNTTLLKIV